MKGCPVCDGQKIVDPRFLEEAKRAFASLTAEMIVFCHEKKVDYRQLPALQEVARCIRILESL